MTQNVVPLNEIPPEVEALWNAGDAPPIEETIEVDPLMMIGAALLAQAGVVTPTEARKILGLPAMTGKQKMMLASMARFVKASGRNFSVIWSEFWPKGGQ